VIDALSRQDVTTYDIPSDFVQAESDERDFDGNGIVMKIR